MPRFARDRAGFRGKPVLCYHSAIWNGGGAMDTRVFWSVLCALLIVLGAAGVAYEVHERWQEYRASFVLEQLQQRTQRELAQEQQDQETRVDQMRHQQAMARMQDWQRRQLRADQRCYAGAVVNVAGSTFTQQIGPDGRPLRCSGNEIVN